MSRKVSPSRTREEEVTEIIETSCEDLIELASLLLSMTGDEDEPLSTLDKFIVH